MFASKSLCSLCYSRAAVLIFAFLYSRHTTPQKQRNLFRDPPTLPFSSLFAFQGCTIASTLYDVLYPIDFHVAKMKWLWAECYLLCHFVQSKHYFHCHLWTPYLQHLLHAPDVRGATSSLTAAERSLFQKQKSIQSVERNTWKAGKSLAIQIKRFPLARLGCLFTLLLTDVTCLEKAVP